MWAIRPKQKDKTPVRLDALQCLESLRKLGLSAIVPYTCTLTEAALKQLLEDSNGNVRQAALLVDSNMIFKKVADFAIDALKDKGAPSDQCMLKGLGVSCAEQILMLGARS